MREIRLTPVGHLCLESAADEAEPKAPAPVRAAFDADWRRGLFVLAAQKTAVADAWTLNYWQQLAQRYLTALCHAPGPAAEVEPPSPAERAALVLSAPPMQGSEYLSAEARVYVVGRYLIEGTSVPGFPFLASMIAIFASAQLFALGIIGEYLARIHVRSMERPAYSIRTMMPSAEPSSESGS